jgi:hypothetical protein
MTKSSNRARVDTKAQQAGNRALHLAAIKRAADFAPIITEIQAIGVTSIHGIAKALDERNIPTVNGRGRWHSAQVARIIARNRTSDSGSTLEAARRRADSR